MALVFCLAQPGFAEAQSKAQLGKDSQGRELGTLTALDPDKGPSQAEAEAEARTVWDAALLRCGGSMFEGLAGGRVTIEMQDVAYLVVPSVVTRADRENGYDYLGTAIAMAKRWRWRSADRAGGGLVWHAWRPGQNLEVQQEPFTAVRRLTVVPDAVLSFDLIRRNGVWAPTYPVSPINSETRSFDAKELAGRTYIPNAKKVDFQGPTSPPRCAQVASR